VSFKTTNNTIVYIAAPANSATGGPELLHQLAHVLLKNSIPCFMFYYGEKSALETPVHSEYIQYEVDYVTEINDSCDNIIIVPERKTALLFDYKNVKKIIWWLSVDNFYLHYSKHEFINKLRHLLINVGIIKEYNFTQKHIMHLVQSHYARQHLKGKGVSGAKYLSDFINLEFFKRAKEVKSKDRKDIVAYNPKKGKTFTDIIIKEAKNITFVPIINMTREGVVSLLLSAKVYIDFGHHPGKDRIPREASVLGCCVITNRKGAAGEDVDVPLSREFKYEESDNVLSDIVSKIEDCLNNYEENLLKQNSYRKFIEREEEAFYEDAKNIFAREEVIK
jgi:hypothetical protein